MIDRAHPALYSFAGFIVGVESDDAVVFAEDHDAGIALELYKDETVKPEEFTEKQWGYKKDRRYPADSVFVVLGIDEETSYYILKPLQNDSKNLNVDKIPVQCYGLFGKAQFSNRHYFDIIDEDN